MSRYPPPGRMLDVGGRRLHVYETGQGSPTVVLEAGIAATSLSWRPVQTGRIDPNGPAGSCGKRTVGKA